jgi:hypothetical protein
LALANWDLPEVDSVLRELSGDQSDIPDPGFVQPEGRAFDSRDRERGAREIRYNAALALARRGSTLTPWELVQETLDEDTLRESTYAENPGMASNWVTKALHDLGELKQAHPAIWSQQPQLTTAVAKLAESSPQVSIRVEAQKVLGSSVATEAAPRRFSREILLIVGVGAAVCLLLGLAVLARWKRTVS